MRVRPVLLSLPFVLAGCSGVDGIWYFVFEYPSDANCEEAVDENFMTGDVPGSGQQSPWTRSQDDQGSPKASFGQIVSLSDGSAVLVLSNRTYEGTKVGQQWTFVWENQSIETSSDQHQTGYIYTEDVTHTVNTEIVMLTAGSIASGTIDIVDIQDEVWTESDEWDSATVGIVSGQIPSSSWLEDAEGRPVSNAPAQQDCQAEPCEITVSTTCTSTGVFEATSTKYGDEDVFGAVEDAGQPYGG